MCGEKYPSSGENLTAPKTGWRATFDALSLRNYRIFWFGTLTSYFAGQMQAPTQAWLAYQLTHSPLLLGVSVAVQGLPQIIASLFSGAIIDRIQKRDVIAWTQAATIVTTLAIAILITTNRVLYWHVLVASVLNGITMAFNMPARNAIVAELVPREKIYNAFALNNGGSNVARIGGPALAGVLIAVIGTQGAYYVGVTFNLLAIITISLLPATSKLGLIKDRSILSNFREGLGYVRLHNIILVLLGMEVILTLFGMSYQGLMPVFAELLGTKSQGYGFMMSAVGIGSLVGAIGIASLGNFGKKGLVLIGSGILFGVTLILFGNSGSLGSWLQLGQSTLYLAAFFLVIIGICSAAYTATSITIIQLFVSDEFRGRTTSLYQMVVSFYPFSILISSAAAQALGAPMALTIGGSCLAIFMLSIAALSRRVRKLE